jgi:hypothetical protein
MISMPIALGGADVCAAGGDSDFEYTKCARERGQENAKRVPRLSGGFEKK